MGERPVVRQALGHLAQRRHAGDLLGDGAGVGAQLSSAQRGTVPLSGTSPSPPGRLGGDVLYRAV
jgi:hypothetical protein